MTATASPPGSTPAGPPHNMTAEKSVLGAVLLDQRHLDGLCVDEGLRASDFFDPNHRLVFEAMVELYNADAKIDYLTVSEQLRLRDRLARVGGPESVEELAAWVPASGHSRDYGRIVKEASRMRELLAAANSIQRDIYARAADPTELLERAERAVLTLGDTERRQGVCSIAEMMQEETDRLHRRSKDHTPITGVASGFAALDQMTGGFQPGNLIILAARPSMGKSALVANFAENVALAEVPVLLFSLEMSKSELSQRFIASQASVEGEKLRRGQVTDQKWPRILQASGRLSKAPLYVDDSSDSSVLDVRAKARRLHHQLEDRGGLGLIIVDYLQLMRPEGRSDSRVEQVGQISRGLKGLARELDVPVIALSQLSRNVEQRAGEKKPVLSDLRESGSLEQDSDLVMFIYRESYYERDSKRPDSADILIAKHRNGPIGEVELTFKPQYPRFENRMAEDLGR